MAARVASVSGKWSQTATWGGSAVPVDGDTVTINIGIVVEFDVDQSGFASGIGVSTFNGTFKLTTTPGTYYYKCNGNVTLGASAQLWLNGGSVGTPAASNVTFTWFFNGSFSLVPNAATIIDVRCAIPTHKQIHLSQAESIAATTLHVDTDVSGGGADSLWASGVIRIDNINPAAVSSEERTLSGVSSTTLTITAGLTAAKLNGAYITLISRNIRFNANGATGTVFSNPTSAYVDCEVRGPNVIFQSSTSCTFAGTCSGGSNVINGSNGLLISGQICGASINSMQGGSISGYVGGVAVALAFCVGVLVSGVINGATTGMSFCVNMLITGTIQYCASGMNGGGGFIGQGAVFANNTRDLSAVADGRLFNCSLASATEFLLYNSVIRAIWNYVESFDHDQVANAFRAWGGIGGVTTSVSTPVFDASRSQSYQIACESTTFPGFYQKELTLQPNMTAFVRCYVRKTVTMAFLPRVQIFQRGKEPLNTGSADTEVLMPADSVDTWEVIEAKYTNSSSVPQPIIIRMLAKNASGNVYFDPIIRTSGYNWQLGEAA